MIAEPQNLADDQGYALHSNLECPDHTALCNAYAGYPSIYHVLSGFLSFLLVDQGARDDQMERSFLE